MQPGGRPFGRSIVVGVVSPSPKLVATSSHSSLLLTILKPWEAQDPDDTL